MVLLATTRARAFATADGDAARRVDPGAMLWLLGWPLAQPELTAWFRAATKGDVTELGVLLAAGQDINAKAALMNEDDRITGSTALMYATSLGCLPAVQYLLEQGANPYISDSNGNTALHMVADTTDSAELAQVLVAAGASTTARNNYDYTPFVEVNQQFTSEYRPGYTPLDLASFATADSIMAALTEHNAAQVAAD